MRYATIGKVFTDEERERKLRQLRELNDAELLDAWRRLGPARAG